MLLYVPPCFVARLLRRDDNQQHNVSASRRPTNNVSLRQHVPLLRPKNAKGNAIIIIRTVWYDTFSGRCRHTVTVSRDGGRPGCGYVPVAQEVPIRGWTLSWIIMLWLLEETKMLLLSWCRADPSSSCVLRAWVRVAARRRVGCTYIARATRECVSGVWVRLAQRAYCACVNWASLSYDTTINKNVHVFFRTAKKKNVFCLNTAGIHKHWQLLQQEYYSTYSYYCMKQKKQRCFHQRDFFFCE